MLVICIPKTGIPLHELEELLNNITENHDVVIFIGDFNIDFQNVKSSQKFKQTQSIQFDN